MLSSGLPTAWYVDVEHVKAEIARVLTPGWHYVGTLIGLGMSDSERLQIPIQVGDVPALLVSERGNIRAFLNVCRHRASRLVDEKCEKAAITCPYHGWTYRLDGKLASAPRLKNELDGKIPDISLHELEVQQWHDLLFVRVDGAQIGPECFDEWIGPIAVGLERAGVDLSALSFHSRASSSCNADWKVVVENYLECYHCQIAHPGLSATIDVRADRYVLESEGHVASQYAVARGAGSESSLDSHPDGAFWLIWPNIVINVLPGINNFSIGPIYSDGAGASHRFLDYLFDPDADPQAVADMLVWDDQVGVEDLVLVERVQEGLHGTVAAGRGDDPVHLMPDSEQLVTWFADRLRQQLGSTL